MTLSLSFERGNVELRLSDEHVVTATVLFHGFSGPEFAVTIPDHDYNFLRKFLEGKVKSLLALDDET